ncbi:tyrosine-type recombinase/integrase [Staphylococcus epidermidis]|uniref:tyrosine-type recombinase/integrase n=1 Tax=Staphylococcus epidermidis TaxID=1282 RepID=UPI0021A4400C|nr:tyrosine-type recombinase/integrase [Staphylococcus epidermidis]MCT2094927.1 tyrosine-type recombinase/integrase [Staphylococcus epidermidis]MCT2125336.1 tyrosine-type recombinase/integrase [Staphylococcus epidermidis]MCT2210698.1 tyrosine-type recombinase/integrase [Staphylococcus epidermidis]
MRKKITTRRENNLSSGAFDVIRKIVTEEKELQNFSQNTISNYNKVFNSLNDYFGDDINPFELSEQNAKDFVKYLKDSHIHYYDKIHKKGVKRGLKPSTVNSYIKLCKSTYETLLNLGYVKYNPFYNIKCLKRQNEKIKTVPTSDLKKLIENLDKNYYTDFRMYVAIHVFLDTFGRIDEVLNITIDDIDFEKKTIFFPVTKNNESRYVTISNKTKNLIVELIEETSNMNESYLFISVNGGRFTNQAFRNQLKKYCSQFKIKTNITPHSLRHTASMLFLENGGNIRVLQKILGHRKLSTTEIYAHVSENLMSIQKENYSPINQILKGNKKYIRARSKRLK